MNRIPPNLLYLTIYNPSIRPNNLIPDDNEDAEEQAHILFYTSKERAVSRDRMLRQIGLAKALVNFAEMFNPNDACNNVHSSTRRMIMVSPEPNFWIHAGIELAKVPRQTQSKPKPKGKGKDKQKAAEVKAKEPEQAFDYEESSVHDLSLRGDILRSYERFKLTHGSFTSILSTLGQQALELQLERFFTVWAWSWDLEQLQSFGEHLGVSLHPASRALTSILDTAFADIAEDVIPLMLSPPHAIPSTRFNNMHYPPALVRHLLTIIPPPVPVVDLSSSVDTIRGKKTAAKEDGQAKGKSSDVAHESGTGMGFLGMPGVNMNMDVRKWGWPGHWTFGRSSQEKYATVEFGSVEEQREEGGVTEKERPKVVGTGGTEAVDTDALEDAMSPDDVSVGGTSSKDARESEDAIEMNQREGELSPDTFNDTPLSENPVAKVERPTSPSPPNGEMDLPSNTSLNEQVAPSVAIVHLPLSDNTTTTRREVHYLIKDQLMLALLGVDLLSADEDESGLSKQKEVLKIIGLKSGALFDIIEKEIEEDRLERQTESIPSATHILQQSDRHIMAKAGYTRSSSEFASRSGHLYNAKLLQEVNPEITEVFSRGQNPQHWHVARRGLHGKFEDIGSKERQCQVDEEGEMFMEVFRKETSLTDVDNALGGLMKNSGFEMSA